MEIEIEKREFVCVNGSKYNMKTIDDCINIVIYLQFRYFKNELKSKNISEQFLCTCILCLFF